MGILNMVNNLMNTLKSDLAEMPQHISQAVEKMDQTIERTASAAGVQLFQTDYLE